jgi:hypothetical protein
MTAQRSGQHITGQILTDEELPAEFLERAPATLGLAGGKSDSRETIMPSKDRT